MAEPEPFSLLLPVYRRDDPGFLEEAFRSAVLDQTLRPEEVVLTVDGPVPAKLDATVRRLTASSPVPVNVVRLPQNRGLALALTAGLEACRNEIVARMDADDVALPERFRLQVTELCERSLDLIGAGMFEFQDETGTVLGRRTPPVGAERIARYARFHDPFNHPTVVYRRGAVRRAGGYRPLGLMEDYWLFARMIQAGCRVDNLPTPLVMYRVGAGAYARRGGLKQLAAELRLQREFRRARFTTPFQAVRNIAVRATYRLVPEGLRRLAYRRLIVKGFHGSGPEEPSTTVVTVRRGSRRGRGKGSKSG